MEIIFGITVNNMDKIIYFNDRNQKEDFCEGERYFAFLEYAFSETDYFMLVYVNYYGKGYSKKMKEIKKALEPYKVKSRSNPSWPGTLWSVCQDTEYKVVFYRNDERAKTVLKSVEKVSDWTRPGYPEDLAFFKGNICWFYSVGHEKIAAIIHASEKDILFAERNNLILKDCKKINYNDRKNYFDKFNEALI